MPKDSTASSKKNATDEETRTVSKHLFEQLEDGLTLKIFEDIHIEENGTFKNIAKKGIVNNHINAYFMRLLNLYGMPTYFVELIDDRTQVVLETIDTNIAIKVRNAVTGNLCETFNTEENKILNTPLLEVYFRQKDQLLKLVSDEHLLAFEIASVEELNAMKNLALEANLFFKGFGAAVDVEFVDIELGFGRIIEEKQFRLFITGEVTPDNCRIWELGSDKKLGREAEAKTEQQLSDAYIELLNRFGIEAIGLARK